MVTFVIIISIFFLILGLVGSVLPIVPGPPLSFFGLLLLHSFTSFNLDGDYLFYFGAFAVIITLLDYWLQIYSVKYFGGGRSSTFGVIIGILFGIFIFPPFGVIVGPFFGAYLGALIESDYDFFKSFKIAIGSLVGFLGGTILKFVYSIICIWYFFDFFI
jgi:uncharacterized protein YqgC (DUF456 family)